MKIIKMIFDNIPRIVIAVTVIWVYFAFGPLFAVIFALVPVSSPYIEKEIHKLKSKQNKLLHEVDDSGEYKSGEYEKQQREFKRRWRLR